MPISVVIGPSGAGKSTLVDKYVAENSNAKLHNSATTRPRRDLDDKSHDFMTDQEFDQAITAGKFIKPVEVYGYRYALPHLPAQTNDILFVMIRYQFVELFRQLYPNSTVVQVEAPVDTLVNRLVKRGDSARANRDAINQEITDGRVLADYTINNDGTLDNSYAKLVDICNNL